MCIALIAPAAAGPRCRDPLDAVGGLALRRSLVPMFPWSGSTKSTIRKAAGIAPFVAHSPVCAWLRAGLGKRGTSQAIDVPERSTRTALAIGALMSMATCRLTASGVGAPKPCRFRDIALLAASFVLLVRSPRAVAAARGGA